MTPDEIKISRILGMNKFLDFKSRKMPTNVKIRLQKKCGGWLDVIQNERGELTFFANVNYVEPTEE